MIKKEIFDYVSSHAAGTVLSFPERGPWGSSKYRGNFSGWIPASIIFRYGCKSVSEIFAGGGTTSDLCGDLQIPYCGIDLNPNPVRKDILSMDILDEQMELPDAFYQADLQMLHPPYPSINGLHYSNSMWKDIEGHEKCNSNIHWKAKVRQVLQSLAKTGKTFNVSRGVWACA